LSRYHRNDRETLQDEQLVLQYLCTNPGAAAAHKLKSRLSTCQWRSADHSAVFEALQRLSSASTAAQLREQLPAQLTRLGFPDLDCEIYFEGEISEGHKLPDLVRTLLRVARASSK
jgi:hypothetical protein